MRSKAAIGGHPIHPALVAIPIGAFTFTLVADLVTWRTGNPGWGDAARYSLVLGVIGALAAAVFGLVDYFGVTMSEAGFKVARLHLILNLIAVALFALSLWLRYRDPDGWCVPGFLVSTLAFLILGSSGWLGGELVFKHKVGVMETDREATELGQKDSR
ncbi:MAG TPA: DUF2231 domain-containing protein [Thermoanaerobaculia bacterium]|jgi:uncharacterized membrane protein|nr:DUF2231 domain-containing protein [Thermoanaerobaculia bacterium]